ncbi:MAG: helix-turn-helix transcriptional regulator [Acidiferrobacteraceae bacterium]
MKTRIPEQKELKQPIAALDYLSTEAGNNLPSAASGGVVKFANFDSPQHVASDGFVAIDDLIAQRESDDTKRRALQEARAWLAAKINGQSGNKSIAQMRLDKGWSQRRLAEALGTSQPHVARIESGREDVRLSTMERLATALDVTVEDIASTLKISQL